MWAYSINLYVQAYKYPDNFYKVDNMAAQHS